MMNCSRGYISKTLVVTITLTIVLVLFVLASLSVKVFLNQNKEKIEQELSGYLNRQVTIGGIYYVPPSFIILKNISVIGDRDKKNAYPLSIERITMVFSIKDLMEKQGLVVNKIYFIKPVVDCEEYPFFLKENIEGIIAFINFLTKDNPMSVVVEGSSYILSRKAGQTSVLSVDAKVKINDKKEIFTSGSIDLRGLFGKKTNDAEKKEEHPEGKIDYRFVGTTRDGGLKIENLEFSEKDLQASLNGELKKDTLWLQGAATLKSAIMAMQAGSSMSATSTPASVSTSWKPRKLRLSPITTRGTPNCRIVPVHIMQGDSVVYITVSR